MDWSRRSRRADKVKIVRAKDPPKDDHDLNLLGFGMASGLSLSHSGGEILV